MIRLTNKLIENVIAETAGEDAIPLVFELKNKKNYSEFALAEKLKVEVNFVRNVLYRLLKYNLVSFTRKKDKRKGWYIYYWTFRPKQIKHVVWTIKTQRLEKLKERLRREESEQFFTCEEKCMRVSFESATDFEFKCPECGKLLNQEDNSDKIKDLEKEIKQLEKELKSDKSDK
ncbi:transcription factor [Candidatus Woesearchaeota archaeon]|nr:transcription factor [Candidatus Woesearchaeota archaeon]MBW3017442.1 transcription factor [Candidatus Woesearchaeota archaeon]